jgi:hypothetical protein
MFLEHTRVLNASKGVQDKNMSLLVDNCTAHPPHMSNIRNVRVVYYPPNRTSMPQLSDLCHYKIMQAALWETPSTKKCVLTGRIKNWQAIHFRTVGWQQVTQTAIVNFFNCVAMVTRNLIPAPKG